MSPPFHFRSLSLPTEGARALSRPSLVAMACGTFFLLTCALLMTSPHSKAMGVMMWEIFTYAKAPYPGTRVRMLPAAIKQGLRMDRPAACPADWFQAFVNPCWQTDPNMRPSFFELVKRMEQLRDRTNIRCLWVEPLCTAIHHQCAQHHWQGDLCFLPNGV